MARTIKDSTPKKMDSEFRENLNRIKGQSSFGRKKALLSGMGENLLRK